MKTAVHRNSLEAYYGLDLTTRQAEVFNALAQLGQATDQQIADYLGYGINRITGRITELRELGAVVEHTTILGACGRPVRVCRLKNKQETLFEV